MKSAYRSRKELASRPHTDGEQMIAHVRMSRELWAGLSAYAAAHGTTASEVVRGEARQIDAAEGRASVRTLTVDDLRSKLADSERVLMWPSKKDLAGTRIRVHASTEKLPSAYRYRADSTQAVCEHDGKGWILVEVVRDKLRQSAVYKHGLEIEPSDSARDHIMATLAFC